MRSSPTYRAAFAAGHGPASGPMAEAHLQQPAPTSGPMIFTPMVAYLPLGETGRGPSAMNLSATQSSNVAVRGAGGYLAGPSAVRCIPGYAPIAIGANGSDSQTEYDSLKGSHTVRRPAGHQSHSDRAQRLDDRDVLWAHLDARIRQVAFRHRDRSPWSTT